jgi:hypothetical protein
MYKDLDPVLNTQVRLAIVSSLIKVKQADFNYLKQQCNTTQGNMSHQLKKLKEVEYIEIIKTFSGNYPKTICKITPKGITAFEAYVKTIKTYLDLE